MTKLTIEFEIDDPHTNEKIEKIINTCAKHCPTTATISDTYREQYLEIQDHLKRNCLFPLDFYLRFEETV